MYLKINKKKCKIHNSSMLQKERKYIQENATENKNKTTTPITKETTQTQKYKNLQRTAENYQKVYNKIQEVKCYKKKLTE